MAALSSPAWRGQYRTQFQKTRMCRYYPEGLCHFGDRCSFSHSVDELCIAPDLHKTSLCKLWQHDACKLPADQCQFAHGKDDLRVTPAFMYTGLSRRAGMDKISSSNENEDEHRSTSNTLDSGGPREKWLATSSNGSPSMASTKSTEAGGSLGLQPFQWGSVSQKPGSPGSSSSMSTQTHLVDKAVQTEANLDPSPFCVCARARCLTAAASTSEDGIADDDVTSPMFRSITLSMSSGGEEEYQPSESATTRTTAGTDEGKLLLDEDPEPFAAQALYLARQQKLPLRLRILSTKPAPYGCFSYNSYQLEI